MSRTPRPGELFLGYATIGLLGFGGVAPWARHVIVEERRWFNERATAVVAFTEFNLLRPLGAAIGLGLLLHQIA